MGKKIIVKIDTPSPEKGRGVDGVELEQIQFVGHRKKVVPFHRQGKGQFAE